MKRLEHTFEIMNFFFFLRIVIFGVVVIFKLRYKLKCFFKTMLCFFMCSNCLIRHQLHLRALYQA